MIFTAIKWYALIRGAFSKPPPAKVLFDRVLVKMIHESIAYDEWPVSGFVNEPPWQPLGTAGSWSVSVAPAESPITRIIGDEA